MRLREFIALALIVAASPAAAQSAAKPALVVKLHPGSATDPAQIRFIAAFREGMAQLGHVEGKSFAFVARFAEGDVPRLPALAAELVRLDPSVIIAGGAVAIRAVRDLTSEIPIVMATSGTDPIASGLVASFARPGGNVTGFSGQLEDVYPKQVELLSELVPGLTDLAVLYIAASPTAPDRLAPLAKVAGAAGLLLHPFPVASLNALDAIFNAARAGNLGAALIMPELLILVGKPEQIAERAQRHRLPAISSYRAFAEAGGLVSFAEDLVDMHRRSAIFVDKILKGAKPGDLPVEQPTKFELVVNLKTAKSLGIAVPRSILVRADEVIE
jgi:putative ABC transport system substrate-binding protein